MSLEQMREEINQIDQKLVDLFRRRMELSKSIGAYKQERPGAGAAGPGGGAGRRGAV